jgi:hypothetical protein
MQNKSETCKHPAARQRRLQAKKEGGASETRQIIKMSYTPIKLSEGY